MCCSSRWFFDLPIRKKTNKIESATAQSNLMFSHQASNSNSGNIRVDIFPDPTLNSHHRDPSQNEVKIEEFAVDQMSPRLSRNDSIRFVIQKEGVMFENPHTPELKAILRKKVLYGLQFRRKLFLI